MKNKKIIYRIAVLLSVFFVLNCGGLSTTSGGGHGDGPGDGSDGSSDGRHGGGGKHGGGNPPGSSPPKVTCKSQGKLSIDNTGACFKAEAIPATFQELVDIIDTKYATDHNADLNKIDVSKIIELTCLFTNSSCTVGAKRPPEMNGKDFSGFNGKIDKWNVSNVKKMYSMFFNNRTFNGDISGWDVSNVTDMSYMFLGATKFNQDISGWDVSKVKDITNMFRSATAMSYPLESWGGKLPANVYKVRVFNGSAVATAGSYPNWCTGRCR